MQVFIDTQIWWAKCKKLKQKEVYTREGEALSLLHQLLALPGLNKPMNQATAVVGGVNDSAMYTNWT